MHVTEAPAEEAVSNVTTVAEVEASNVTESIESIVLPEVGSAAKEHSASLAVFFLLFVLILSIFLLHLLLKVKFHYLPESLAMGNNDISTYKCQVYIFYLKILFTVFLGAVVGMIMMTLPEQETKRIEAFSPTMFFLILLPPIIFESGYNLVLFVVRRIIEYSFTFYSS